MSRSQPKLENPSKRFFKWQGKTGQICYWDKELGENGENVNISFPFAFLVLDELSTIRGFCKADDSGFWSNEVKSTTKQPLTVRTKAGIKETGLYKELRTKGIKYAKSVYVAFYDEQKNLQIGNIAFVGASLSAWIDFQKKYPVQKQGAVIIQNRSEELTNGDTKYFEPVFQFKAKVSDEVEEKALELDRELQTYLRAYFAAQSEVEESPEDYVTARNRELEDYDEKASAASVGETNFSSMVGDNDYSSSSDDDIPF